MNMSNVDIEKQKCQFLSNKRKGGSWGWVGGWGAVSGTGGNVTYIWLWNGMLSLHGIRLKQMRTQQSQALHRTPAKANKKRSATTSPVQVSTFLAKETSLVT